MRIFYSGTRRLPSSVTRPLASFQKFAALEPKSPIPWIFLSECEGKLKQNSEALAAAKKATALSPAMTYAWIELARAEKASGTCGGKS